MKTLGAIAFAGGVVIAASASYAEVPVYGGVMDRLHDGQAKVCFHLKSPAQWYFVAAQTTQATDIVMAYRLGQAIGFFIADPAASEKCHPNGENVDAWPARDFDQ